MNQFKSNSCETRRNIFIDLNNVIFTFDEDLDLFGSRSRTQTNIKRDAIKLDKEGGTGTTAAFVGKEMHIRKLGVMFKPSTGVAVKCCGPSG